MWRKVILKENVCYENTCHKAGSLVNSDNYETFYTDLKTDAKNFALITREYFSRGKVFLN